MIKNSISVQSRPGKQVVMGATFVDSLKDRSKIYIFFNSRKFQKAKHKFVMHWRLSTLYLHFTYNYLHSIYIVLGSISNLEMIWASLVAQMVKNMPALWETLVGMIRGTGRSLWRRAWQPTPIFLPRESPRTQETGSLQPMESQRAGHD